jgi:hypothetical protein
MNIFCSRVLGLSLLMATSAAFAQSQASSAGFNFTASAAPCPKTVDGYAAGQTYASAVKRCLGDPAHEDHNPDGHFVYIYNLPEGQMTAFLFDSTSMLVRTRSYGHKSETSSWVTPDWVQLSHHDNGNTSFVDQANSRRDGKMYRAWVMTNFAKAVGGALSVKMEELINCESEQWSPLAMYSYSAPNGEGQTILSQTVAPGKIPPAISIKRGSGSEAEDVLKFGCSGSK